MKLLNNYGVKFATLLSFTFFSVMPASAREKSMMRLALNQYNAAAKEYKKGPEAFINTYSQFSKSDKKDFVTLFKGAGELPKASLNGETITFELKGEKSHTLELVNGEKAEFKVDGKAFTYDRALSLANNAKHLEKVMGQKTVSLLDLLIPNASAEVSAWLWYGLIIAVSGGLAYWVAHVYKDRELKVDAGLHVDSTVNAQPYVQ